MAKKRYERLSQREYAARLGVSNTAVSEAIKNRLIVKGWDAKEKRIIVELADLEWGSIARKKPITININKLPGADNVPDEKDSKPGKLKIGANADMHEARRVREVAQAQLAIMELGEKQGLLVNKLDVQKELTLFGQEIRKAIEQIPARSIDAIRAANTRNEALEILDNAIYDTLMKLTDLSANLFKK